MSRAIIVIPTYNESDNIEKLVKQLIEIPLQLSILIVDDNSPDGTGEIADRLAKEFHEVHVIHRKCKSGLGTAYVEGFKYALQEGFDYIFEMDADFSHDPKYIPVFLEKIRDYDMVLGSRYLGGISVVNWSFYRLTLSLLASKYVKIWTGMPFSDPLGGFKVFRKEVLERIELGNIVSDGYVFQMEMLFRAYTNGFRIGEIPIIFIDRGFGRSKMSRKVIFEAIYKVPAIGLGFLIKKALRGFK